MIPNTLNTHTKSSSKPSRGKLAALVAAGILAITAGCDQRSSAAEIGLTPADALKVVEIQKPTRTAVMRILGELLEMRCNYTRIKVNGITAKATAAHCLSGKEMDPDMVITHNFPEAAAFINPHPIKTRNAPGYSTPRISQITKLSPEELIEKNFEIEGCFPDESGDHCYKMIGKPVIYADGYFVFYLQKEDAEKIFSSNTNPNRVTIEGMSGSPVFVDGKFVGTLSKATAINPTIIEQLNRNDGFQEGELIFATYVRGEKGIFTHLPEK